MRAALALALVLALALPGCAEPSSGGLFAADPRIGPAEALPKATAEALAWREDAVLLRIQGQARTAEDPGFFTFGKRGAVAKVDGLADTWQFTFTVPGTVALVVVDVTSDGDVSSKRIDLSSFAPDTGDYREYFDLTPIEPEWLEMEGMVAALRANATTYPFTEGDVAFVEYTLQPDVRALYGWTVKAARANGTLEADLDPRAWTFLEVVTRAGDGVTRFDDGEGESRPPSGLAVRDAYGIRNGTEEGLWRLRFDLTLSSAGRAFDLSEFEVVVTDGARERRYGWTGDAAFRIERDTSAVKPGDRFTVEVDLVDHTIGPRTKGNVRFATPKGAPVDLPFETPLTYGKGTVVRLS